MGCGKSKPADVAAGSTVIARKKPDDDVSNAGKVETSSGSMSSESSDAQVVAGAEVEKGVDVGKKIDGEPVEGVSEVAPEPVGEQVKAASAPETEKVEEAPVAAPVEEKPVQEAKAEIVASVADEIVTVDENAQPEAAAGAGTESKQRNAGEEAA